MFRLYIFLLFLFCIHPCYGQGKNCTKVDSTLCYVIEQFPKPEIVLEKKIESKANVSTIGNALLADMDGDCVPELIIPSDDYKKILIIDSKSGKTKWVINTPYLDSQTPSIAIADLDGDGIPEVLHNVRSLASYPLNVQGRIICYNASGSVRWISDQKADFDLGNEIGGNIAAADFNQDGIPEIYTRNKIFNGLTGILLADGGSNGRGGGHFTGGSIFPPLSMAAQLDNDSTDLELAAGFTVYKVKITNVNGQTGNSMVATNIMVNNEFRDGYTTVADINSDGILDIVVAAIAISNDVFLYAYTLTNGIPKLLAKASFPADIAATFAPPCIGDIKGIGKPSILYSVYNMSATVYAFSFDGTSTFKQDWSLNTTDRGSPTILALFDFDHDGIQEIVFRDNSDLRIFNGSVSPPTQITKSFCPSTTWLEYPIIGDLDNSGHAKICIPCGSDLDIRTGKLTVFGPPDSLPGWAPARGIWNQYNYHVLNINDDLTVPRIEKNNATYKKGKYNNFFVQESLLDENGIYRKPAAGLWGKITCVNYNPLIDQYTVNFSLYNLMDASMNADSNLLVTFYNGNPETNGVLLNIYHTKKKINAGDSLLNLEFAFSASNLAQLFMVVNTKRNGNGIFNKQDFLVTECDYADNIIQTAELPKLEKTDTTYCVGDGIHFLDTLIYNPGIYYHKWSNIKGCDSLISIINLKIDKNCIPKCNSTSIDSSLCYIPEKYPVSKFAIEQKLESKDLVSANQPVLLADMDGDCIPEFIVTGENYNGATSDRIFIIDSKTGATKWSFNTPLIDFHLAGLAVADIDNDGIPEIFIETRVTGDSLSQKLICYHANGVLVWISNEQTVDQNTHPNNIYGGTPALADFNGDGVPEIYVNNKIFNARTGVKLADGTAYGLGGEQRNGFYSDGLSIAAQLDDDPSDLELAAGYTIYKVIITNTNGTAGNSMKAYNIQVDNKYRDGFTTVADINSDGRLDVIVSAPGIAGLLYAYTLIKGVPQLLAKTYSGSTVEYIGPPFAGDIKGTGKPSILITRQKRLDSYSYDGTSTFYHDWSLATTDMSGETGVTMFDFNLDGVQEIVYRDETTLRVIDGSSTPPKELASFNCLSQTRAEYPIVGDIDNSGHAKICVPCGKDPTSLLGKLTVFSSPKSLPGWAPARGIWNQYNYHVLNINDDLTVPRVEKNNATYKNGKYNNFYVQESLLDSNGMYLKRAASLAGKIKCINYDPINNEYTVIFDIYNRADASFNAVSSLPVSFYNGDPATTGILIGIYYTLKKIERGDSLLNLVFKFSVSNLSDLFMVVNTKRNGSGQFNPADFSIAECDYTDNTFHTLDLPKIEKLNATICKGEEYNFFGTLIHDAGVYYNKQNNVKGCDSLISIMDLITVDTVHAVQSIQICDAYSWNGKTYTQSGTFMFDTINGFGCDSLTTLDLVIKSSNSINIPHTACDSFSWNGITYDKSGSYPYKTANQFGCDSITTLDLIINKSNDQIINYNACNNYFWNGQTFTQSGTYKFDTLNQFGCDSMVTLNLSINSVINASIVNSACDSYIWNGQTYTQSGSYQYKTINGLGCDSIITLQLTINKSSNSNTFITNCDSFIWNGQTYTQSGSYQFKTLNVAGCDSIATLQLLINKSSNSSKAVTTCDSYIWNGQTYTQSGTYQINTLNVAGCDSIVFLQLTINKADSLQINQSKCDNYTWNGNTYDKSGVYQYKSVNINGCDSITNLNLTINKSSRADLALSVCDSLSFLGQILKANGNYSFMLSNANGCDSLINLNLSIRSEIHNNTATNCDTFKWNISGLTYNQSGVYLQKYTNSFGCDSIYKLDLSILKSYELVDQAEACKEYFWPVNKTLLKQSGEYTYPLKTSQGCDSIIKLNLIVNHDFEKRDTIITDTAYTWPINQQTYPSSGSYQEHFTSSGGCDSIHYLLLIIKNDVGIYYPNVIHPGGINSWFTLFDNGKTIALISSLSIYDRWGDLVWQKHNFVANELQLGWDGRFQGQDVLPGVYVWHAQLALKDGTAIAKKGDVTVVR